MTWFAGAFFKIATIVFVIVLFGFQWSQGYFRKLGLSLKTAGIGIPPAPLFTLFLLGMAAVTADPYLLKLIRESAHPFSKFIASFGGFLGRNIHPWAMVFLLYIAGWVSRRRVLSKVAFGCLVSAVLASICTFLLKFIFLRARPYAMMGHLSFLNWAGLSEDARKFQSFSSGDVAVVAGIVFYLFITLKQHFLKWFLVLLPLSTAFSRIAANKHWPSDTFISMAVGFIVARFVIHHERIDCKD